MQPRDLQLLELLGDSYTNRVNDRLRRMALIPNSVIEMLAVNALAEHWGPNNYVLLKYLAVHVGWSVEQGRFTENGDQFYFAAGHLQTRYGTPLYLRFEENKFPDGPPYALVYAGDQLSAPELPPPPDIPEPPEIPRGAEIVMMHGHILGSNAARVPFLEKTPPVAQICAVTGAIQWSINRGLQLPYWYFGRMNYVVPLYLQDRENITLAPDLIAPVQVNADSLVVRTVLEPTMPYANARVAVRRHDQLPPWLLDSWAREAATVSEAQLDDPEAREGPQQHERTEPLVPLDSSSSPQ